MPPLCVLYEANGESVNWMHFFSLCHRNDARLSPWIYTWASGDLSGDHWFPSGPRLTRQGARALTEVGKSKRRSKLNLISLLIVLRKTWNRTMALIDQEPSTETSAGFPCVTFTVVMLKERWLRLQFLSQEAFNNVFLNNQRVNVEQSQTNKAHPACRPRVIQEDPFPVGPGWRRHCAGAHLHGQKEGFNQSPGVDYTLLQVWDPPLTGAFLLRW